MEPIATRLNSGHMDVAVVVTALALLTGRLVRAIRRDGLGERPPPDARPHWARGTTLDPVR